MKISDRAYFALKRLHSLTGVVPVGLFLLEHFFTNSRALQGPSAFDQAAADLARLPYVTLVEALGIWVPILFHGVLGAIIATTSQANLGRHGYARNWQYTLQRATGVALILYIAFHTWQTRFDSGYLNSPSAYRYVHDLLQNPAMLAFYALGVIAASYHLGNGLFGFAIHWGLATGRRAQTWVARASLGVSVGLALVGLNALLAFTGHGFYPGWLTKPHAAEHASVVFHGGTR